MKAARVGVRLALDAAKAAVLGSLLSTSLLVGSPALADQALPSIGLPTAAERAPTFQETSISFADSLIPIVGSLKAKPVAPLASKAVALATTGDPKEIIKTIDAGLEVFLSVPPERFFAAARTLKEGTALAAQAPACNLVCLPPAEQTAKVARVAADALSVADPAKLKAFVFQGGMSLASGDKSQYAGVLGEAVKFSFSLDKDEVVRAKDAGVALLLSVDNPANARAAAPMPPTKAFPKNKDVEAAAMQLADALYPIVRQLEAKSVAPVASKVVAQAATGDPKEIIRTIDAGLAAFLSVPPERFFAAAAALKQGTAAAALSADCGLVCVPPLPMVEMVAGAAANALSVTDPDKLQGFVLQAVRSLESGDAKQLAGVLAELRRFESSFRPTDVAYAKAASVELLAASGVSDPAVLGLFK